MDKKEGIQQWTNGWKKDGNEIIQQWTKYNGATGILDCWWPDFWEPDC